tara:strand:- start:490 stop:636 length:147 start_codon:yes stop_codon:yes gene_type:complete
MAIEERVVTIVSFEEFTDLMKIIGNDELAAMELVEAIAQINTIMYEYS